MTEKWGGGVVHIKCVHRKNNICSEDILKHELCYKKAPLILATSFIYIVFNTVWHCIRKIYIFISQRILISLFQNIQDSLCKDVVRTGTFKSFKKSLVTMQFITHQYLNMETLLLYFFSIAGNVGLPLQGLKGWPKFFVVVCIKLIKFDFIWLQT